MKGVKQENKSSGKCSGNGAGIEGARVIGEILKKNNPLITLDLRSKEKSVL